MCILSWSLCAISCRVLCAVLYVHLLMTLLFLCASSDSYGRRAELARTALFPTPCGWTMMRKFAVASKRKRISILFPKRCFRMGPMSLTSICNIMLLTGFFESSKSHLSSGRRDRSCSSTEELWCIGAIRDCDDKGFIYFAKSQRTAFIYVEEVTSQGGNVRVCTQTGAFSEGLATSHCSASSIDRHVVVRRERAIDPL